MRSYTTEELKNRHAKARGVLDQEGVKALDLSDEQSVKLVEIVDDYLAMEDWVNDLYTNKEVSKAFQQLAKNGRLFSEALRQISQPMSVGTWRMMLSEQRGQSIDVTWSKRDSLGQVYEDVAAFSEDIASRANLLLNELPRGKKGQPSKVLVDGFVKRLAALYKDNTGKNAATTDTPSDSKAKKTYSGRFFDFACACMRLVGIYHKTNQGWGDAINRALGKKRK
ncbi:MAG: hypothetical protein M0P73_19200 [Syntrophobacterales bacterium]|nr:hypothetical protein [Syntrophobacterales bacterium]